MGENARFDSRSDSPAKSVSPDRGRSRRRAIRGQSKGDSALRYSSPSPLRSEVPEDRAQRKMKAREQERNAHKKAALQLWEQQMKTEKERARKREAKSLRMKRDAARTTARITRQHMLRRAERVQGDASKARNFGLRLLNGVISLSAQVVTVLAAGGVPSKGQSLPRSVRLRFCSVMGAVAKCQEGAENAKCNEQAGVGNADENICILLGNSGGAVFAAMYVVGRVPACRAGGRRPRTLPIYEWQPWDTGAAGGLIAENAFRDYLEASKDMQVCSEYRRICPEKYRPDPMKVINKFEWTRIARWKAGRDEWYKL